MHTSDSVNARQERDSQGKTRMGGMHEVAPKRFSFRRVYVHFHFDASPAFHPAGCCRHGVAFGKFADGIYTEG